MANSLWQQEATAAESMPTSDGVGKQKEGRRGEGAEEGAAAAGNKKHSIENACTFSNGLSYEEASSPQAATAPPPQQEQHRNQGSQAVTAGVENGAATAAGSSAEAGRAVSRQVVEGRVVLRDFGQKLKEAVYKQADTCSGDLSQAAQKVVETRHRQLCEFHGWEWPGRWRVKGRIRASGNNAGQVDCYITSPRGVRFRSLLEAERKWLHELSGGQAVFCTDDASSAAARMAAGTSAKAKPPPEAVQGSKAGGPDAGKDEGRAASAAKPEKPSRRGAAAAAAADGKGGATRRPRRGVSQPFDYRYMEELYKLEQFMEQASRSQSGSHTAGVGSGGEEGSCDRGATSVQQQGKSRLSNRVLSTAATEREGAEGQSKPSTLGVAEGEATAGGSVKAQMMRKNPKQSEEEAFHNNSYKKWVSRCKGQLSRMRLEEAALEAYSAEGFGGRGRDRVRLSAELRRVEVQLQRCRDIIRECVRQCDINQGARPIPRESYDEDGQLDQCMIFCALCEDPTCHDDNDILLCDGECGCAYHERCVDMVGKAQDLSEDEPWYCPSCLAKYEMLVSINEAFDLNYTLATRWQEVLSEEQQALLEHLQRSVPADDAERSAGEAGGSEAAAAAAAEDKDGSDNGLAMLLAGPELPSDEEDDDFQAPRSDGEGEPVAQRPRQRRRPRCAAKQEPEKAPGGREAAAAGARRGAPGRRPTRRSRRRTASGDALAHGGDGEEEGSDGDAGAKEQTTLPSEQELSLSASNSEEEEDSDEEKEEEGLERSGDEEEDEDSSGEQKAGPASVGKVRGLKRRQRDAVASSRSNGKRRSPPVGDASGSDPDAGSLEHGVGLVLHHKRRRTRVDYVMLNAQMFGDYEAFHGEFQPDEPDGDVDEEFGV